MQFKPGMLVKMRRRATGDYVCSLYIRDKPCVRDGSGFSMDDNSKLLHDGPYNNEILEVLDHDLKSTSVWCPEHKGYDWFPDDYLVAI